MPIPLRDSIESFLWNLDSMENTAFDEALAQMWIAPLVHKILEAQTVLGKRTSPIGAIHMLLEGTYPKWVLTDEEIAKLEKPQLLTPQDFIPEEFRNDAWKTMSDKEFYEILEHYPDFKERMYRCLCKTETSPAWIISNLRRWLKPLWFFEYEDAVVENKAA